MTDILAYFGIFDGYFRQHAACWRPALGFSLERFPQHWHVVADADKVSQVDGLGSYGSFPIPMLGETGSLSDPAIAKMHCTRQQCLLRTTMPPLANRKFRRPDKVNWDLSGRFYHFMGMYAPPVGDGAPGESDLI